MLRELIVVSHKYPPYASGGLAPYVRRSLDGLRRSRPDLPITLYTLDYPDGMPREAVEPNGLRVVRPRMPRWLRHRYLDGGRGFRFSGRLWFGVVMALFNVRVLARVVGHLRRTGRDGALVGVHDWQSTPVGIAAALLLRIPVAYHVHNTELTMTVAGRGRDPWGLIRRFERWAGRVAAVVVVPTPDMRDELTTRGWDARRIAVVPHGHETPELLALARSDPNGRRERLRRRLGLGARDRVLVFAGRLSPVKGIATLLRALPDVVRVHPALRLLVLGVGFPGTGESAAVHQLVRETGLADRIRLYDAHLPAEDVFEHYELADACAFPSTFEPFGLVSVEAMALGRPVVLGPGFSDVIAVGDHGPVAYRAPDCPRRLAAVLTAVLSDPAGAAAMGERGRRHVQARLTWAHSSARLLTAYDQITTASTTVDQRRTPCSP
jgi:glycogen(starch) synthase